MSVDLENALRELAPRLIRYLTARTGDRSLAEDVAQESLIGLVRRCVARATERSKELGRNA